MKRLTGIPSLAYTGVEASTPPEYVIHDRAPNPNDSKNFDIGTFWLHKIGKRNTPEYIRDLWHLVNLEGNAQKAEIATWIKVTGGAGSLITITGNTGGPVPTDGLGNVNVIGAAGVAVAGNPGTNTLTITAGAGVATNYTTDAGMAAPIANNLNILGGDLINTEGAADTITVNLDEGLNGQVPIAATGMPTLFNTLTAGAGIAIANGANNITISATGGAGTVVGFLARLGTQANNVTGDGTVINLGAAPTVALTEIVDFDNNFTPGDGAAVPATFTAPSDGLYILELGAEILGTNSGSGEDCQFIITTSNRTYTTSFASQDLFGDGAGSLYMTILADMEENDTATFSLLVGNMGRAQDTGIGATNTFVGGALISAAAAAPLQVHTNNGDATEMMGAINLFGDDNVAPNLIETSGDGVDTINVSMVEGLDGQIPIAATGGETAYNTITAGTLIDVHNLPNGIAISLDDGLDGQIPIASTVGDTEYATITPGALTSITNGNNSILIGMSQGTNGQIPIASTGNPTIYNTITAGANITVTNGPNTITIAATGGGVVPGYATGLFTPTLTFAGSGAGVVYTTRYGEFTRIGNLVWVLIVIETSSKGAHGGADPASVTDLPYTFQNAGTNETANGHTGTGMGITYPAGYTYASAHFFEVGNHISLDVIGSGLTSIQLNWNNFSNASRFRIAAFYFTNDPF